MKVICGTENTTILSSLPTTFDKYGWRTDGTLNGQFQAGTWHFYITLITGKYVTGDLIVYVRLWKSANADGSGATALTDWLQIASVSSPTANTTYNLSGSASLSALSLSNEYLFVEYIIATTSACGSSQGCSVTFRCNEGASPQKIEAPTFTSAVGWLTGWQYRKSHEINGSTAGEQTNYQIKITAHYGSGEDSGEDVYLNGHCRTDFGDVRFTDNDGVTELDYWMEEKVDGDYAVFWVEVPSIPASPNKATIYIYYGKSDATTTSDGEATFLFFDHFEGTSLDPSKWVEISGDVTVSNSWVYLKDLDTGTIAKIRAGANWLYNVAWRAKAKLLYLYGWVSLGIRTPTSAYDSVIFNLDKDEVLYAWTENEGVRTTTSVTKDTDEHIWEGAWVSGQAKYWIDGTLVATHTTNVPDEGLYPRSAALRHAEGLNAGIALDWFFVRKYVEPEPSHGAWGSEETAVAVETVVAKMFPMLYLPKVTLTERNVKLLATLTAEGSPLSGKTIHYYHRVSGATEWTYDGTSVTDSEGKATKILTLDVPQTYDFKAEFQGDETYASSSDQVSDESISAVERFRAQALMSKVRGATIKHVAKDFPQALIKEGKAEELRSKFS